MASNSLNQIDVQSIIKEELKIKGEHDLTTENYVQTLIKAELEIENFKEESEDVTTPTSYVQPVIKEELIIEDFIVEAAADSTTGTCVETPIKEFDIEKFKEEPDVTTPTTYVQSVIKEELIIEDFKEESDLTSPEKMPHDNDTGHGDDMLADASDFAEYDKLQNNDQKGCNSKTKSKTAKKPSLTSPTVSSRCTRSSAFRTAEKSVPVLYEASTSKKLPGSRIKGNLDDAVEEYGRTYCSKCKKNEIIVYRVARCFTCKTTLRYDCQVCCITYKSLSDMNKHMMSKHVRRSEADKRYECDNCHKTFALLKRFNEHRRACIDQPSYFCLCCSYVARFKSNLTSHMNAVHGKFEAICPKCGGKFTNKRSYERHLTQYCGKVKRFSCHHCDVKVHRRDQIFDHLKRKHPHVYTL